MVDNNELSFEASRLGTVGELIDYIKANIDPDAIILSLTKDESPLSDNDWLMPLASFKESKFEIVTGSKVDFIRNRLEMVDSLVMEICENISNISNSFKRGLENQAHESFASSLNDLNAFVTWLHSIYLIDEEMFSSNIKEFEKIIEDLKGTCLDIQTCQMQQSWWNLGDILDVKVIATLNKINSMNNESLNKLLS
jgi:hypothetical protein